MSRSPQPVEPPCRVIDQMGFPGHIVALQLHVPCPGLGDEQK